MDEKLVKLSRTVSYLLRHQPSEHGLQLDHEGWVQLTYLFQVIRRYYPKLAWASKQALEDILKQSDKQRFQLSSEAIRALYGHSTEQTIEKVAVKPPTQLYHGTTAQAAKDILKNGLKPMARQNVHMSTDETTAMIVGKRRTKRPTILVVNALAAFRQGIRFYHGNDKVWLADFIPPEFLRKD